ncbi:uncharacterized protein ACNS7B_017668 [Menidia menidia]
MASWALASQLILISLSWNVYCYPAQGWNQHDSTGASSSMVNTGHQTDQYPGFNPWAKPAGPTVSWVAARPPRRDLPSQPPIPEGPAVSWVVDGVPQMSSFAQNPEQSTNMWMTKPPMTEFPSSPSQPKPMPWMETRVPQNVPAGPSNQNKPQPSWLAASNVYPSASSSMPARVPVGPTSAQLSANPQSGHGNVSPAYQPGELRQFQGGFEQGTSQSETGQTSEMVPLPPVPPFPQPTYQGGELTTSSSHYERGTSEEESEDSYIPMPPYAAVDMPPTYPGGPMPPTYPGGPMPPIYPGGPVLPNLFYLFLTGQLPHGTVTHVQTDFEAGKDRTTQAGYESYRMSSENPTQGQVAVWQPVQQQNFAGF